MLNDVTIFIGCFFSELSTTILDRAMLYMLDNIVCRSTRLVKEFDITMFTIFLRTIPAVKLDRGIL